VILSGSLIEFDLVANDGMEEGRQQEEFTIVNPESSIGDIINATPAHKNAQNKYHVSNITKELLDMVIQDQQNEDAPDYGDMWSSQEQSKKRRATSTSTVPTHCTIRQIVYAIGCALVAIVLCMVFAKEAAVVDKYAIAGDRVCVINPQAFHQRNYTEATIMNTYHESAFGVDPYAYGSWSGYGFLQIGTYDNSFGVNDSNYHSVYHQPPHVTMNRNDAPVQNIDYRFRVNKYHVLISQVGHFRCAFSMDEHFADDLHDGFDIKVIFDPNARRPRAWHRTNKHECHRL
jgi:hypothetical protein